MKFWQKIFLSTIIIFVIVFNISVYFLTSYSYEFTRKRENESSIREQNVILSSVSLAISNAETVYPGASTDVNRLIAVIKPLAEFYDKQGVLLALFENNNKVFSNIEHTPESLLVIKNEQSKNTMDMVLSEKRYGFVSSQVSEYPHLTFVYARDISGIDDYRVNISRVFIIVSIIVFTFFLLSIFLLLKHMTRPITKLNEITAEIADGAYTKRVSLNRRDELGKLGDSFNCMADSVEKNIAKLTKDAENKQQFIDDLTHEMKTPLTSILGYSEYLKNAKSTEDERLLAIEHLHNAALRLKNLSVKLLELTFLRSEPMKFELIDIKSLFKALSGLMYPILEEKNLSLTLLTDINSIKGDETLLLSLLTNLVENSAKASKPGGTIIMKAYEKDLPVIEIIDNGRGMEKEEIEKITEPFYCVDKSRSREFGGVGLGLSIVSQIVKLHGAKLEIESEPEKGTTMRIYFTTP